MQITNITFQYSKARQWTLQCLLIGAMCLVIVVHTAVAKPTNNDNLFPADPSQATPLKLELIFNHRQILRPKNSDPQQVPALARWHLDQIAMGVPEQNQETKQATSSPLELDVHISRRGKSRQKQCKFPPLWIKFDKKAVKDTLFGGQKRLKLVTHCADNFESRGYLAAELLAYRMLNALTDHSFRVRAVHVKYIDKDSNRSRTHWAFLIEHKDKLAKRLKGKAVKVEKISRKTLDPNHSSIVALHQLLIANTDFSFAQGPANDNCCHNVAPILISTPNSSAKAADVNSALGPTHFPIPYDFDATGFVNPPYAVPVPSTGLKSVSQRLFRGYCRHNAHIENAARHMIDNKHILIQMIENFSDIPYLRTARLRKFTDKFFAIIEDPRQVKRKIINKCRAG